MYVDGFVIAVPLANRAAFLDHARLIDGLLIEFGALRIVETLADDVAHGTVTDFYRAVAATDDETVAFSWIEWPDKETRDAGMARLRADPRLDGTTVPFDGQRLVWGGFAPVVELTAGS